MAQAAEVLFASGLSEFAALSVASDAGADGYAAALAALNQAASPDLLAVEDGSQAVLAAVKTFV